MPLRHVQGSTVVASSVVFGAFLARFATLPADAVGRTAVLLALVVSGFVALVLSEAFVVSRVALHRARHPARLVAAVGRGAVQALAPDEPVRDAMRLMLLRKRLLESPVLPTVLPRTMRTARGTDAGWLAPLMKNTANGVVLARTDRQLLVCEPDADRVVHLVAAVPFSQVDFVEWGAVNWLGRPRILIGIGFDDGSSIAVAQSPEFGAVVARFFVPLVHGVT